MSKPVRETVVTLKDPATEKPGDLKHVGGSRSDAFNMALVDQTISALWLSNSTSTDHRDKQVRAALAALMGVKPADEIEGMIAAQLIASHNAAMECYRRAMIGEQTFEGRRENLSQANKLSRTYATLVEALNRHRGKGGEQKIIVERVNVAAGGQAIVGNVERGEGSREKSAEQPHAKQVAHEPLVPMRGANEKGDGVPLAVDAKRTVQTARR